MNLFGAVATYLLAAIAPGAGAASAAPTRKLRGAWQSGFSRTSDVEFRRLLERLPAAAYTCDADGLITYYNERALELWGRAPKLNDPVDRFCGSFRLFAVDGTPIPHEECWMGLALRHNRAYNGEEILIEREDGSRLSALAHANPLHDELGMVVGAVNVLVDISDRKRAERVLQEADRSKNEFLAILAHELRNPLAPMHNALQLMQAAEGDATAAAQARGTLERQLQHLTRVVDDLLDLSRITRNALELRSDRVELASVIHQALETCRPLAEASGHEIKVSLPRRPIYLHADAVRLAQLFSNLLNNACKYTPANGRVSVSAEREGSDVVVTVMDSGIGIRPEALQSIFKMFTRSDDSRALSQDGLGIGLTLAKTVVELHGGSIQAFSDGPGLGSELRVRLPMILTRLETRPTRPRARPRVAASHGRRVLVVDDNSDSADSLAELLDLSGHETRTARDGVEALETAATFRPQVILLDIGLPKMNGYQVAREIRKTKGSDPVLVALTGWGQAEDRLKSQQAGFDHHLVKPVDFAVLSELLESTSAASSPRTRSSSSARSRGSRRPA